MAGGGTEGRRHRHVVGEAILSRMGEATARVRRYRPTFLPRKMVLTEWLETGMSLRQDQGSCQRYIDIKNKERKERRAKCGKPGTGE